MLSNWCSLLLLPFNEMHKLSILECTFVTTVPAFIGQVGREEVVTRPCGEGCALTAARESPGWFGVFFFFHSFVLTASDQSAYRTRPTMPPPRKKCMTGPGTAQSSSQFVLNISAPYTSYTSPSTPTPSLTASMMSPAVLFLRLVTLFLLAAFHERPCTHRLCGLRINAMAVNSEDLRILRHLVT